MDTTFGTGGLVTTDFSGSSLDQASEMVLQSDGKIVVGGYSDAGGSNDFALARYSSDGSLDTTFGTGGLVTTDFSGSSDDQARQMVLQSDGKIVVGGYSDAGGSGDFALARYSSDGSLDTTFGTGGLVTTDFSGSSLDQAGPVVLQSDGKIVVGGYSDAGGSNDFALARYSSDGSLDTTFGTGGLVTTNFSGSSSDVAIATVLQSDGKIVVGGISSAGGSIDFALARYGSDGSLDTTFGTGGRKRSSKSILQAVRK
ncbi:MAG: hypothetical protein HYU97_10030 [Deltaproteobacteria bacterium]|nr:hypothetical protein [Deltaproteobacteria bacterium]